ncbi:MAG: hypothetical protein GXP43_03545 [bacterium]|nr:hypothetical protein [bacterium]
MGWGRADKKTGLGWLALTAIIGLVVVNLFLWRTNQTQKTVIKRLKNKLSKIGSEGFLVTQVLDGDTFTLVSGQRVRLADVDAPEKDFCLGKQAKQRLTDLVLGKKVVFKDTRVDKFGRSIALVYQKDAFINKIMLEEGWGRYDASQTSMDKLLLKAAHKARKAKLGVWRFCTPAAPPNKNCAIKGNIEKHFGKKVYHFPGCSGYNVVLVELDRGENWFCSEKQAQKAGFVKSKKCYGKKYQSNK